MRSVSKKSRIASAIGAMRRHRWPLLFIAPFFILFAIFGMYPIVFSLWLSLHEWNGVPGQMRFVGLENFVFLLHDEFFWGSMLNAAIIFMLHVPLLLLLSLVVANALNSSLLKLRGLWRALIFMPHLTSMVAAGWTFRLMFDSEGSVVNQILLSIGLPAVAWLDSVWGARITLSILLIWAWLGYETVIFLAALQTIPVELSEAATVDGATSSQIFWYITVPLLRPTIIFCATISVIGTFGMFTEPTILTGGGPVRATETPMMVIFSEAFRYVKFGYASALSYVYFACIVMAALFQLRFNREKP